MKSYHISKHIIVVLMSLLILLMTSCQKKLVEDYFQDEIINGIHVHWNMQYNEFQRGVVRDIINNMVFVEGGVFLMGATDEFETLAESNQYPAHYVELSDFYICKNEILIQQYHDIIDGTRKQYNEGLRTWNQCTWDDWNEFVTLLKDISGVNFSLPTEAQWEYAARGGIYSKGFLYPGSNNWADVWDQGKNNSQSIPNELGIFHMADQLHEWVKDYYYLYTNELIVKDPVSINNVAGSLYNVGHVIRGGAYYNSSDIEKKGLVTYRTNLSISTKTSNITIRLVINNIPGY